MWGVVPQVVSCPDFSLGLSGMHIPGHRWSLVALGGRGRRGGLSLKARDDCYVISVRVGPAEPRQGDGCLTSKMSKPQCQRVVDEEGSPFSLLPRLSH